MPDDIHALLQAFGPPWSEAGEMDVIPVLQGFSGGQVWKVSAGGKSAALRRYPVGFSRSRAEAIHQVLDLAVRECPFIPTIHRTRSGATLIGKQSLHELLTWMPGEPAAPATLSADQFRAAIDAIGRWHQVGFPADGSFRDSLGPAGPARSHCVERRLREWGRLKPMVREYRANSSIDDDALPLVERTQRMVADHARPFEELLPWESKRVAADICLVDVHREHVLFTGSQVTGLIDFSTLRSDGLAVDIARYLGSFDPRIIANLCQWRLSELGLPRSLIDQMDSETLVPLLAWTGCAVSALHWFEWLIVDRRPFADRTAPLRRWRELLDRADQWSEWSRSAPVVTFPR